MYVVDRNKIFFITDDASGLEDTLTIFLRVEYRADEKNPEIVFDTGSCDAGALDKEDTQALISWLQEKIVGMGKEPQQPIENLLANVVDGMEVKDLWSKIGDTQDNRNALWLLIDKNRLKVEQGRYLFHNRGVSTWKALADISEEEMGRLEEILAQGPPGWVRRIIGEQAAKNESTGNEYS